jgi:hypothetical protein
LDKDGGDPVSGANTRWPGLVQFVALQLFAAYLCSLYEIFMSPNIRSAEERSVKKSQKRGQHQMDQIVVGCH